ncbi:MAG TPA: hypothetical protein VF692_03685 [Pyrinomonadaceae bacterium]
MKLRIKGNSLRLRLLRGEVEQFGKIGRVADTIRFGASHAALLSYVLESSREIEKIAAEFSNNVIIVKVPDEIAKDWVETGQVTLKAEHLIDNSEPTDTDKIDASENVLTILIEKDFVCPDGKDEPDNADAFPQPTGKCG